MRTGTRYASSPPGLVLALVVVAAIAAALPKTATAQEPEARSTLDGVFSAEQVEDGRVAYEKSCTACHAPGYFTASTFQRSWSRRALYWLFKEIRTTMPEDNPGSLDRRETSEILAYILSLNGYPAGDLPLPHEDDPLRLIVLEAMPDGG